MSSSGYQQLSTTAPPRSPDTEPPQGSAGWGVNPRRSAHDSTPAVQSAVDFDLAPGANGGADDFDAQDELVHAELDDLEANLKQQARRHEHTEMVELSGGKSKADGSRRASSPTSSPSGGKKRLRILCFDLTSWHPMLQMGTLSVGVFVFFLANGFIEEFTFSRLPEKFEFGMYLTFFELMVFAVLALLERKFLSGEPFLAHKAPLDRHGIVAGAMTISRGLTNVSMEYLNYPTQVIFKSMKLVTVMIGSIVWQKKSFSGREYLAAVLLVLSAMMFSLGDVKVAPDYNTTGIVIVLLSLIADSAHANSQEIVLSGHEASVTETMLFTNFFAGCISLVYIVFTGELWPAMEFCNKYPVAYSMFVLRAACIYMGVVFFVSLIKRFDAVLANSVTTVRKIMTIVMSFVLFPKPITSMYLYGGLVFTAGVYVNLQVLRSRK